MYALPNLIFHLSQLIYYRPNILALNLATSTLVSLALLLLFMAIAGTLLYFFHKKTYVCCNAGPPEGLQRRVLISSNWSLVIISFLLTILYLPLSTMAMHVLVWSEDLWVVPNPYVSATSFPPQLPPLGPADQYREPLDFCWTTTMQRNQLNYAPVIVILSLICVAGVSSLRRISCPRPLIVQTTYIADRLVPPLPASNYHANGSDRRYIHRNGSAPKSKRDGSRIPTTARSRPKPADIFV